jgi:uncharacterized MnhB-related membrane protein
MVLTNRQLITAAIVGTVASVAVASVFWMIVTHPVAVAQVLSRGL